MALARIDWFHVALPLRKAIKHSSHERTTSESIFVRATLDDGSIGFGEGVPRPYVTGESIATAIEAIEAIDVAPMLGEPDSFEQAVDRIDAVTLPTIQDDPRGMFGNAARCALELALLDAFGRRFGRSVGDAVRHLIRGRRFLRPEPGPVRYSGAITAESPRKERISAIKMRAYGFRQVKVKVGVAGQDDPARLRRFRLLLGSAMDLRLDANEAWSAAEVLDRVEPLRRFDPSALEQPVPHAEIEAMAELRPRIGLPVMLDESLCGEPDGRRAVERGLADLFNVRISKCGGIGPTLRLIELADRHGLGVQLGCHPGESGLLSAAGRHLACNLSGLRFLEGSYDRHVLLENPTTPDITFGYGGRAWPIPGPGLGVQVDPARLERLSLAHREVSHG
ncbi:dipeptide epimerase [Tautonia sociabilis]|uniref:Dipeptide epimerase n=1 Tax=Tautonia sociabilis TaxID=2080755 RepID=A0A432MM64_9BACT|nr:dipeptide epimerase [Tautonia sociabilis]RUL88502.1 dipeptide epimerase [Tautonia sociabilis]